MIREPFYPCQTVSGETYVVDGRTGKIASSIACSFDTAERWHIAKLRARRLNDDYLGQAYARRLRRVVFAFFGLIVVLVEVINGDLPELAHRIINAIL